MSGALIGQTLELWSGELRTIKPQIRSLFGHASVAASAAALLDGLLGPERRKTGWMRAEAAGDPGPRRQQAVLGRSRWDADALRDLVRDYALATLAVPDAVLVIDETGFLKQGTSSCIGLLPPRTLSRLHRRRDHEVDDALVEGLVVRVDELDQHLVRPGGQAGDDDRL